MENGKASLILGIITLAIIPIAGGLIGTIGIITGIIGIILGIISVKKTKSKIAIAGLVMSIIGTVILLFLLVFSIYVASSLILTRPY